MGRRPRKDPNMQALINEIVNDRVPALPRTREEYIPIKTIVSKPKEYIMESKSSCGNDKDSPLDDEEDPQTDEMGVNTTKHGEI